MQSMVLSRESISSVYAVVIPVRPLFATSSLVRLTAGTHSDTVFGTALRRACGASCIRLAGYVPPSLVVLSWQVADAWLSLFSSPGCSFVPYFSMRAR